MYLAMCLGAAPNQVHRIISCPFAGFVGVYKDIRGPKETKFESRERGIVDDVNPPSKFGVEGFQRSARAKPHSIKVIK